MNFKHLVLVTALFMSGIYSNMNAQVLDSETRVVIRERVQDYMNDLNISEKDEVQFVSILRDQFIAVVALSETNFSQKTKHKIIKTTTAERDQRMKALLSKEQYNVFQARVKLRKDQLIEMSKQRNDSK